MRGVNQEKLMLILKETSGRLVAKRHKSNALTHRCLQRSRGIIVEVTGKEGNKAHREGGVKRKRGRRTHESDHLAHRFGNVPDRDWGRRRGKKETS